MKVDTQFVKGTQRFPFRFIDFLNGLFLLLPTTLILWSSLMIRNYNMNNMTGINGLLIASLIMGLIGLSLVVLFIKRFKILNSLRLQLDLILLRMLI